VIGDMISPFKAALGVDYKAFENRLLAAIHLRFGLPASVRSELADQIKQADRIAAYLEATRLAGFSVDEARRFFGNPRGLTGLAPEFSHALMPLPATKAASQYLAAFAKLQAGS
jgi:5'-deoxynucleotidase YfbR-like HD superfamily hydrolase